MPYGTYERLRKEPRKKKTFRSKYMRFLQDLYQHLRHFLSRVPLEVTLLNGVKLGRFCRHFGFAMATGGRKPAACSKMLIFSHLVNFGRNFPSSLLCWQNGLGTAWPGWEAEVKRPEYLITSVTNLFMVCFLICFSKR